MQDEIWKPIKGYEGLYEVSNLGRVKSLRREMDSKIKHNKKIIKKEKIIKNISDKDNYLYCSLHKNGLRTNKRVHRLVAEAFLSEYDDSLEINHLDCNRINNKVDNLELCTRKSNMEHASKMGRMKPINKKKVCQYGKDKILIKSYESIALASKCVGISPTNISLAINKKIKTAGGYIWRCENEQI